MLKSIKKLFGKCNSINNSIEFSKPAISDDPSVTYRNFKYHYELLVKYFDDTVIPFLNQYADLTETYALHKGKSAMCVYSGVYLDLVKYLDDSHDTCISTSVRFKLVDGLISNIDNTHFGHKVSIKMMLDHYGLTTDQHITIVEYNSKFIDYIYDCYAMDQVKSSWQLSAPEDV